VRNPLRTSVNVGVGGPLHRVEQQHRQRAEHDHGGPPRTLPPGFEVATQDLDAYKTCQVLSAYEITGKQLMPYLSTLPASVSQAFKSRQQATVPVTASDGGAEVYLYCQPKQRNDAKAVTLQVAEARTSI